MLLCLRLLDTAYPPESDSCWDPRQGRRKGHRRSDWVSLERAQLPDGQGEALVAGNRSRATAGFAYFGNRQKEAIAGYEFFVRDRIYQARRLELLGGGLIRSSGGWSQVFSLRRHGETLRLTREIRSLEALCQEIARNEGIREMEPRSGGRSLKVRRARNCSVLRAAGGSRWATRELRWCGF
jgi:hypothetical protein